MPSRDARPLDADAVQRQLAAALAARDLLDGLAPAGPAAAPDSPSAHHAPHAPAGRLAPSSREVIVEPVVALRQLVARARVTGDLGAVPPPMHRQRGLRRRLAQAVARGVLTVSRFLVRDQRATNQDALTAVEHAADALERLAGCVADVEARWTLRLADEAAARHRAEARAVDAAAVADAQRAEAGRLAARLAVLEGHLDELAATTAARAEASARRDDDLAARVAAISTLLADTTAGLADTTAGLAERAARLEARTTELADATDTLRRDVTRAREMADDEVLEHLRATERRLAAEIALLHASVVPRLDDVAAQVGALPPDIHQFATLRAASEVADAALRDAYAAFEARFRGDRCLIRERLRIAHLPRLHAHLAPFPPDAPWIDLGCGRGEWLDVLAAAHVPALGVDLNPGMLAAARDAGREVVEAEALAYLTRCAPGSACGISALHVAEHLRHEELFALLAEARRVVRPGGLLILETPNPENLQVGAHTFHLDPTHRRPLPPQLLAFLVEHAGWELIDVPRLHADEMPPATERAPGDDAPSSALLDDVRRIGHLLFGPRDFAVIARRPPDDDPAACAPSAS